MALIVQKYGGSSLANAKRIKNVAYRVAKVKERGDQVVVVVSAIGTTTDELLSLAYRVSERPDKKKLDLLLSTGELVSSNLLAIALESLGYKAVSLSGAETGIQTDTNFGQARIQKIEPQRILKELKQEKIVIVAGFQGITKRGDITTLGRGGSDVTAVALAAALGAKMCEIYTDVEGIRNADPRIVPAAGRLEEISYEEALELASCGAEVIHPRAVELGWNYKMPILIASSFNDNPGTIIHSL